MKEEAFRRAVFEDKPEEETTRRIHAFIDSISVLLAPEPYNPNDPNAVSIIRLLRLKLASGSARLRRAFITNQSMFQSTAELTLLLYYKLHQTRILQFIECLVILINMSISPLTTSEPYWSLKTPITQLAELLQMDRLHSVRKVVIRLKQHFWGEATPRSVLVKRSTSLIAHVSKRV